MNNRLLHAAAALTALMIAPSAFADGVYKHSRFAVDIGPDFRVSQKDETPTGGLLIDADFLTVKLGCSVTILPLNGTPANPATWNLPDRVVANPELAFPLAAGTTQTFLRAQKFAGRSGFPSVELAVEKTDAAGKTKVSVMTHTILDPSTQAIMSCVQDDGYNRSEITDGEIDEMLKMGESLRPPE